MSEEQKSFTRVTIRGTLWSNAILYSGKIISLVSTIILARLLTQDDFGVAGYALLFTSFVDMISGLGISQSLIYHDEEEGIFNTGFWSSVGIGLLLFIVTFAAAPLMGLYFNDPRSVAVIQVLGLTYPLAGLSNVHVALICKNLSFGRQFVPEVSNAFVKALISITLAAFGFGPWSIIIGAVAGKLVGTIAYWLVYPWRPSPVFHRAQFNKLISYGANNSLVDIVSTVQSNIDYLLISRFMGASALGVYSLAFRLPEILITQFCVALSDVIFPIFSILKEDLESLQRGFIKSTLYSSLITVPISIGLALVSRPLVLLLFSDKWVEAIPVIQAISIYFLAMALPYQAGVIYKAKGRQVILTYLSVGEMIVLTPALYWVVQNTHSIVYVGWAQAFFALLFGIFEVGLAIRIIRVPVKTFLGALIPSLTAGLIMCAVVLAVNPWIETLNLIVQLIVIIILGGLVYLGGVFLIKRDILISFGRILKSSLLKEAE